MQTNKVTNEPIIDDYDTLGQTYVISSENILLQAIRSLSLASDPEFVGGKEKQPLGSRVRTFIQDVAQSLGYSKDGAEGPSSDPEKIALGGLVRNLSVAREDVASVLTVTYSSSDPKKAAAIVNTIVDTYVNDMIAGKMRSTNVAGKVVQERVEELKQQYNTTAYLIGHAGDGNIHVEFPYANEDQFKRALSLDTLIVNRAIDLGGTATGEHGVGMGKAMFMQHEHGQALDVMRSIKQVLDPTGILNPGKIFPEAVPVTEYRTESLPT